MNQAIFDFLNGFAGRSGVFDTLVIFVAEYLIWWILLAVFVFVLTRKVFFVRKVGMLAFILGAGFVAWVLSQILNIYTVVARPFLVGDVNLLFEHGGLDSFPSGHTTIVFALALGVYFYNKKCGAWLLGGAFLVGLSRVVAGVHWPADILAGLVLGVVVAVIFWFLRGRVFR